MTYSMKKSAILLPKFKLPSKVECYEEVANHSQRIFTLNKITIPWLFLHDITH